MSLKKLLAQFEGRSVFPIEVDEVRDWLINHGYQDKILFYPVDMDEKKLKGFIVQYSMHDAAYGSPVWVSEIAYAKSLKANECWRRFVCCKEMMQILDRPEEKAKTAEQIAGLIQVLSAPPNPQTATEQSVSDNLAIFKALLVLAPPDAVEKLREVYKSGIKSEYDIAAFFRIPEYYVSLLFSPLYAEIAKQLLRDGEPKKNS